MGQFPGTCEIVESKEGLDFAQHSNGSTPSSSEARVDDKAGKLPKLKMAQNFSVDDDLNQLFEAIVLRTKARCLSQSHQLGTDSSRKDVLKHPNRVGVSKASGIGISESVNLKQALRGLRISHASEMAAMKRLSKPVGLSGASEAGAIKRLYRAVVVEASESDEGKGSLVEISLVPEKGTFNSEKISVSLQGPKTKSSSLPTHSSPQSAVGTTTTVSVTNTPSKDEVVCVPREVGRETSTLKLWHKGRLKSTPSCNNGNKALELNEIVPAKAEIACETSMLELGRNFKPHCSPCLSSSSAGSQVSKSIKNSPCVAKPVVRKKCFVKKKVKQDPISTCSSSSTQNEDGNVGLGPNTSKLVCQTHNCDQEKVSIESASPPFSSAILSVEDCSINADSGASKPYFSSNRCIDRSVCANMSLSSRSREMGEASQSSKCSIGEYSCSTSISEESIPSGSSFSGSRPHMSKDLRWNAIHNVEMQHGSLGLRHFNLLKRLGCGDIGTVYLAELTRTNCLFALKVMDNEFLGSSKKMPRAQTEREIMQMLDHPFLPTLFAHFTTDKFSCLVMEYCPGGDMHVLRQRQPGNSFAEQAARFYAAEVLLALEYLHMLGVVYRDLKPENILIREDGHIMLSDFDLALRCTVSPMLVRPSSSVTGPTKRFSDPCMESKCLDPFCLQPSWAQVPCFSPRLISGAVKTRKLKSDQGTQLNPFPQLVAEPTSARSNSFVGTHEYLAPEIIKGEGHGNAVDWWTFGIFLYELLFGKTPFQGIGNDDTLANVVLQSLKFPKSPRVSFQARDLIRRLLIKDPKKRLGSVKGATEIRQHPFFEGLNWALIRCAVPPELPKSCNSVVPATACEQEEIKSVEFQMTGEVVES